MRATELKHVAQDEIMQGIQHAFYATANNADYTEEQIGFINSEISKQMARVEKLFGFEPYSWGRG